MLLNYLWNTSPKTSCSVKYLHFHCLVTPNTVRRCKSSLYIIVETQVKDMFLNQLIEVDGFANMYAVDCMSKFLLLSHFFRIYTLQTDRHFTITDSNHYEYQL